jgi:hypothetical protein
VSLANDAITLTGADVVIVVAIAIVVVFVSRWLG